MRKVRGFTLLEIIVVLGLMALITTLLLPLAFDRADRYKLSAATREVASAFRYTRAKALNSQKPQTITFNLNQMSYEISDEKPKKLDSDIDFDIFAADQDISEDGQRVGIRFYPDGSSTGGRVKLLYGDDARGVDVIWMTGQIRTLDEVSADD